MLVANDIKLGTVQHNSCTETLLLFAKYYTTRKNKFGSLLQDDDIWKAVAEED